MLAECPKCNTRYDVPEYGKYECANCGCHFRVEKEEEPDIDKTIPPQRARQNQVSAADDMTMPGKRDRKPDGRFQTGDLIMNRYKVLAELGQGGMGVVYRCLDETAGIEVALKALPPELSHNSFEMEDIKDNFQLVSSLVHQNIAISKQLEKDNTNGNYYLIMECIEGEDLRHWIRRKRNEGTLTVETVLPIIRQVASALDYAHRKKVMHRDIKPGNIMINAEGDIKVLDFGLAAQIHTSMTRVSMAFRETSGTGPYMAPEQWEGRAQDAKADQYALAVMAYEMLAGHLPFESSEPSILREAVLKSELLPIENVPPHVNAAIFRAMSKNSADRFDSCSEFASALGGKAIKPQAQPKEHDTPKEHRDIIISVPSFEFAKVQEFVKNSLINILIWMLKVFKKISIGVFAISIAVCLILVGHELYEAAQTAIRTRHVENERRIAAEKRRAEEERLAEVRKAEAAARKAAEAARKAEEEKRLIALGGKVFALPNGIKLEMVKIKAGTFTMGSPEGELGHFSWEKQHQVTLTKDYWLGKFEVTQAQYEAVMGTNPSYYKGSNRPVEMVSWEDAKKFCNKLNDLYSGKLPAGYRFDLPTEAQWEYACRAGTTTALNNGKNLTSENGACYNLNEVGWYDKNYGSDGHKEIGQKRPNAWGLYDMHGNVGEWCRDWHEEDYSGAATDPTGPSTGSFRVYRGGFWVGRAWLCRSAYRNNCVPGDRGSLLGFRLALAPVQ